MGQRCYARRIARGGKPERGVRRRSGRVVWLMRKALIVLVVAVAATAFAGCGGGASETCAKRCDKAAACMIPDAGDALGCKKAEACEAQSDNPGKCSPDSFLRYWDCHANCVRVADCYAYQKCAKGCLTSCTP